MQEEIENLKKSVDYYRSGVMHIRPQWVPDEIFLPSPVASDVPFPGAERIIAPAGIHKAVSNQFGALSVYVGNQLLGVKPKEFEPRSWKKNPHLPTIDI